jgi:hypothetical protein
MAQRKCSALQIVFCKGISKIGSDRVRPVSEPLLQVIVLIIHSGQGITSGVSSRIQLFPRIQLDSTERSRLSLEF